MVRMHDGELAGRVSIEFAERLLTSGAAQRIGREKLRYVRLVPGIVMARSSSGWDLIEEGDANTAMRRSGAVPTVSCTDREWQRRLYCCLMVRSVSGS